MLALIVLLLALSSGNGGSEKSSKAKLKLSFSVKDLPREALIPQIVEEVNEDSAVGDKRFDITY